MATCHLFSVVLIKRIAKIDLRLGASLFGVCSNLKPNTSTTRDCRPFSKSIRSIVFDKEDGGNEAVFLLYESVVPNGLACFLGSNILA